MRHIMVIAIVIGLGACEEDEGDVATPENPTTEVCGACTEDDACDIGGIEGSHCEFGYCCYDIGDGSGCGYASQDDADDACL